MRPAAYPGFGALIPTCQSHIVMGSRQLVQTHCAYPADAAEMSHPPAKPRPRIDECFCLKSRHGKCPNRLVFAKFARRAARDACQYGFYPPLTCPLLDIRE